MRKNLFPPGTDVKILGSDILEDLYSPSTKIGLEFVDDGSKIKLFNVDTKSIVCRHFPLETGQVLYHLQSKGKRDLCPKCVNSEGAKRGFVVDLDKKTLENEYFRLGVFDSPNCQIICQKLKPKEVIECEKHNYSDQIFYFVSGTGTVSLKEQSYPVKRGYSAFIPSGVCHKITNNSSERSLKFFVFYSPPMHPTSYKQFDEKYKIDDIYQTRFPVSGDYESLMASKEEEDYAQHNNMSFSKFEVRLTYNRSMVFAPFDCQAYRILTDERKYLIFVLPNKIKFILTSLWGGYGNKILWEDFDWKTPDSAVASEILNMVPAQEGEETPTPIFTTPMKIDDKVASFPPYEAVIISVYYPKDLILNANFETAITSGKTKVFRRKENT